MRDWQASPSCRGFRHLPIPFLVSWDSGLCPPAPRESEPRVQWPSGDRGKGSGGSYIGGETKEEDAKKVQRDEKKLAEYEAECVEGMRHGFDMNVESANSPPRCRTHSQ
jgi:hypothetical protein